MVGRVAIPGDTYAVRYAGNGLHAIHHVNRIAFSFPDQPISVREGPMQLPRAQHEGQAKSTITHLALYTKAAKKAAGSKNAIKAVAQLTREAINAGFKVQKSKAKIKIVAIKQIKGPDSTTRGYGRGQQDLGTMLTNLREPSDGVYDKAHRDHDRKKADQVILYSAGDGSGFGSCGLAFVPQTINPFNERSQFSVVR